MMRANKNIFIGIVIGAFITGIAGYLCMPKLARQWSRPQLLEQQRQITQQAEMIEYIRQSGLGNLMSNLLQKVEDELKDSPGRMLSDGTIAQIAALSYSFKPYKHPEGDSVFERMVSPERGQLLLMLLGMDMDTSSFNKILARTSFAGADLRDADLRQAHLNGVDLGGADLQGANLQEASLNKANFKSANLWGANLKQAILQGADMKTADLRWSDMNGVDLKSADLNGADMTSAQLRKADMSGADLHFAEFSGAFLTESNLTGANMISTNMKRTQLEKAILVRANLTSTHLDEADLTGANLTGVNLTGASLTGTDLSETELNGVVVTDKEWLSRLDQWKVAAAKEIQRKYKITDFSTSQETKYQLEKN